MISDDLARSLRAAGVRWEPAPGDRFRIERETIADQVFTLAEMVIEEHRLASGRYFGFNGTTEWALDSIPVEETLWLPREDQLRGLLGEAFVALEYRNGEHVVTARVAGGELIVQRAHDPADAYARAVLALVTLALL